MMDTITIGQYLHFIPVPDENEVHVIVDNDGEFQMTSISLEELRETIDELSQVYQALTKGTTAMEEMEKGEMQINR